ncbi:hypothetical protein [Azospirillum lipoferum]|uniref:hypothetical protein n=1 Tax=Azospirillum lipoferum TaxID=193 RepID=UPI0013960355|nr:hypothetical protein [Azospirillum lipoferum]
MSNRIVLVCGMFSSASTWTFNVVVDLLRLTTPCHVAFAAILNGETRLPTPPNGTALVLKTHGWGDPAAFLDRHPDIRCLVTIRDPRDAVVSLMQRFDYGFDHALSYAAQGAGGIVGAACQPESLLLRYENGFMDQAMTIGLIAAHLSLQPSAAEMEALFQRLRPDAVQATIVEAELKNRFPKGLPPGETADPATQWHPGHIGDRLIGKYARFLDQTRQTAVVARMAPYMAHFGYGT